MRNNTKEQMSHETLNIKTKFKKKKKKKMGYIEQRIKACWSDTRENNF